MATDKKSNSPTEKLMESLQRLNQSLVDISEKTILSDPDFPRPKMLGLNEQEILQAFRKCFEDNQVDEKYRMIKSGGLDDKLRVTKRQKLMEQKALLETTLQGVLDEQMKVQRNINNSFEMLKSMKEKEEMLFV